MNPSPWVHPEERVFHFLGVICQGRKLDPDGLTGFSASVLQGGSPGQTLSRGGREATEMTKLAAFKIKCRTEKRYRLWLLLCFSVSRSLWFRGSWRCSRVQRVLNNYGVELRIARPWWITGIYFQDVMMFIFCLPMIYLVVSRGRRCHHFNIWPGDWRLAHQHRRQRTDVTSPPNRLLCLHPPCRTSYC